MKCGAVVFSAAIWWSCGLVLSTGSWREGAKSTTSVVAVYPGVFQGSGDPSPELASWSGDASANPPKVQMLIRDSRSEPSTDFEWSPAIGSMVDPSWIPRYSQLESDQISDRAVPVDAEKRSHMRYPSSERDVIWIDDLKQARRRQSSDRGDEFFITSDVEQDLRQRTVDCVETDDACGSTVTGKQDDVVRKRTSLKEPPDDFSPISVFRGYRSVQVAAPTPHQPMLLPVVLSQTRFPISITSFRPLPESARDQSGVYNPGSWAPSGAFEGARRFDLASLFLRMRRRDGVQKNIRIHQCYFNPVSCFKK